MPDNEIVLTLIGGPTVLIECFGLRLLTDPTFDGPGTYDARGVVLEKKTGPAISAEAVGRVDAVLLSHDQHFDNLDHAGRVILGKAGKTFTTRAGAQRLGASSVGLSPWETSELASPHGHLHYVTATPARHGPRGIEPISGEVTGFMLGRKEPGDTVYVTGDTVWYEGVAEVARRFQPRLVILFTGSAKPRGRFHLTMDTNDAVEGAYAFPNAKIVAVHNEGWAHFTETQEDVASVFSVLGLTGRLCVLERGHPRRIVL